MPKFVFDTNILISRLADKLRSYKTLYVSAVVLHERMTAANDLGEYRSYLATWQKAQKEKLLLVPAMEDWQTATRIAYALAQTAEWRQVSKTYSKGETRYSP